MARDPRALRVRVLGQPIVEGVPDARVGSRKARTLLKLLAVARGHAVRVEELVEHLWGDRPPTQPADQVAVLVSRLRAALGSERLRHSDAGYALTYDWLDLEAFESLASEAASRLAAGSPGLARAAATAALGLLQGPLLADEVDPEWATLARSQLASLEADCRRTHAEASLALGDPGDAIRMAGILLARHPYDEAAAGLRMRAYVRAGRPAQALVEYADLAQRLRDDLGVSPSPALRTLHQQILTEKDIQPATDQAAVQPLRLPGRSRELRMLNAVLDQVAADHGQAIVVEGEAGIGKSRLVRDWTAHMTGAAIVVLQGRCGELERSLPLQPILDALQSYLYRLEPRKAAELLGPDATLLAPLFGRVETASALRVGLLSVDERAGRSLLYGALLSVFGRIARAAPTILVIEDVHAADSSTAS